MQDTRVYGHSHPPQPSPVRNRNGLGAGTCPRSAGPTGPGTTLLLLSYTGSIGVRWPAVLTPVRPQDPDSDPYEYQRAQEAPPMTLRFLSEGLAVAITQHSGRCCSPLSPDTPQDARVPRDPRRAGLAPPTSGPCRLTGPVDGVLTTVPGLEVQAGRQFSPYHPEPAVCGPPGRSGGPTRGCGRGVGAAAIVRGSGGQRAVRPPGEAAAPTPGHGARLAGALASPAPSATCPPSPGSTAACGASLSRSGVNLP